MTGPYALAQDWPPDVNQPCPDCKGTGFTPAWAKGVTLLEQGEWECCISCDGTGHVLPEDEDEGADRNEPADTFHADTERMRQ